MSKKSKKCLPDLPDLEPIEYALVDARALVNCAYQIVVNGRDEYGESSLLRIAVEKLQSVAEQLDDAAHQLARFRKEAQPLP
jgi:hypothetical protein